MADWNPKANDLFLLAAEIEGPADRRRFFFLAMAHGKPGERDTARWWYYRALA